MRLSVVPSAGEPSARALDERPDDDLMALACAGRRAAFEVLVGRHARRVAAFCAKNLGERHLGEEIAQEVWLAIWDARQEYRAEGKFVVWLFTIARNRIRNARRDAARLPKFVEVHEHTDDPRDQSPGELDKILVAERRARVGRALARLSTPHREALSLRFSQDLSYEEVAAVLSTNESTVRSRVFHGLRELRRYLRGEG